MAKGIMVVESAPSSPEREAEYHAWYDGEHIPAILKVPGFLSARRFRRRDDLRGEAGADRPPFLAIYEFEAEDLGAPLAELSAASAAGRTASSDVLQTSPPPVISIYELLD